MKKDQPASEFENVALKLFDLDDRQLAAIALPAIADRLPAGYGAQLPIDKVGEWIRNAATRTLTSAGEHGREILSLLNDEGVRGDIHLIAILAAHLVHVLSKTDMPVEAIAALALLLARHYRPRQ